MQAGSPNQTALIESLNLDRYDYDFICKELEKNDEIYIIGNPLNIEDMFSEGIPNALDNLVLPIRLYPGDKSALTYYLSRGLWVHE